MLVARMKAVPFFPGAGAVTPPAGKAAGPRFHQTLPTTNSGGSSWHSLCRLICTGGCWIRQALLEHGSNLLQGFEKSLVAVAVPGDTRWRATNPIPHG